MVLADKTVGVIGGAGFIGSHIVEEVIKEGGKVRVLDDLSTGSLQNFTSESLHYIKFILGSISDLILLSQFIINCDYIIHLAAKISVEESKKQSINYYKVNAIGEETVQQLCLKYQKKLIITSSAAVVSPSTSPYAYTKWLNETKIRYHNKFVHKPIMKALRLFNVYGERQRNTGAVVPSIINSLLNHKEVIITGDGTQKRDFIYVKDVAKNYIKELLNDDIKRDGIILVGTGKKTSVNALYDLISNKITPTKSPKYINDSCGAKDSVCPDPPNFNFTPLEEGLKKTINWNRRNQ